MDPTFTPKQVLRALGIKHGTLSSWGHRGLLTGLTAATKPGKARQFTQTDLTCLGIMKTLLELGLSAETSHEIARLCIPYMEVGNVHEFGFFIAKDGTPTLLIDEPVVPGTGVKLTIYPHLIVNTMKAKLGGPDGAPYEDDVGG
jgi:hypothetical protein